MYTFLGLALICDLYFVSSLDSISEALHLSEDVAGATFMAAGSSAPELFTSIIAVFGPENDIGVGTIVGSAVFNILIIIGLTAIFAGKTLILDWRPLVRDSFCYSISIILLMITFYDGVVEWWESIVFVVGYAMYVTVMAFNADIMNIIENIFTVIPICKYWQYSEPNVDELVTEPTEAETELETLPNVDELMAEATRLYTIGSSAHNGNGATNGNGNAATLHPDSASSKSSTEMPPASPAAVQLTEATSAAESAAAKDGKEETALPIANGEEEEEEEEEKEASGCWAVCPFPLAESWYGWIIWAIGLPYYVAFFLTVPDCTKPFWNKFYLLTFGGSIFWIALLSYFMVDWANKIGCILGIDPAIMGLTFLAAGTSVPDALSSVMVAREGLGDMAVSNAIGSNVFDILLGLGLPWLLATCIFTPGKAIVVSSAGLIFFITFLFVVLLLCVGMIALGRWRLFWWMGVILIMCYDVYVIIAIALVVIPRVAAQLGLSLVL